MTGDLHIIAYDTGFVQLATLAFLCAHEGKKFQTIFPGLKNVELGNMTLEASKISFLIFQSIKEMADNNNETIKHIIDNLVFFIENPGFSVDLTKSSEEKS